MNFEQPVNKIENDYTPDDLMQSLEVKEFAVELKSNLKSMGMKFFEIYEKINHEVKTTIDEEAMKKSPYYHALVGSSGLGQGSLEFNDEVDNQIKEIVRRNFIEQV